jgi:hypothetical protein
MKRPTPIVRHVYGRSGQLMVDQLSEILYTRNPAMSLVFAPEQRCLHITGFPEMCQSECIGILSEVKSPHWDLTFKGKTAQGIIIIQFIPPPNDHDLALNDRESVRRSMIEANRNLFTRRIRSQFRGLARGTKSSSRH